MPFVPFTDEELCSLEDAFGRIEPATPKPLPPRKWRKEETTEPAWQAVFAVPTPAAAKRFETAANDDRPATKADGIRNASVDMIVALSVNGVKTIATSREDRKAVVEAWRVLREGPGGYPGAHLATQEAIMNLCGIQAEDAGKG